VWQLYPQRDSAHFAKLAAFLRTYLDDAEAGLKGGVEQAFDTWNLGGALKLPPFGTSSPWAAQARRRQQLLRSTPDLTTQLRRFAAEKR
jgi:hypothetical protein